MQVVMLRWYRKDLASHLTDNLVTHMSLLAMENRKLKQQGEKAEVEIKNLKAQQEKVAIENRELKQQLEKQAEDFRSEQKSIRSALCHYDLFCPLQGYACEWTSEPFWNYLGGYNLQLKVSLFYNQESLFGKVQLETEFGVKTPPSLQVVIVLVDQLNGTKNKTLEMPHYQHPFYISRFVYVKDRYLLFRITDITQT